VIDWFIEADGNFHCEYKLNSKGITEQAKTYMRVSQKQMYKVTCDLSTKNNSNLQIMEKLENFLM
jgi:hypothetical protein